MLGFIKRYFEKRNQEIAAAEYRDGFEWAFGERLLEGVPLSHIEGQLFRNSSEFDNGAADALLVMQSVEGPLDNASIRYARKIN